MSPLDLARNLAISLTQGAWTVETLQAVLVRRLPGALHASAPSFARQVISTLPGAYAPPPETVAKALRDMNAFARVLRYCRRYGLTPNPDLASPVMAPIPAFARLEVPDLPTLDRLANWLMLPLDRLDYVSDVTSRHENHGETAINHYFYALHAKKSGGTRVIEAPKPALKAIQRRILQGIVDQLPAHPAAYGFVKGRNCKIAASRHAGEQVVVSFDMADFFPSLTAPRIFGLFRCLGYPQAVAHCLTGFCTTATPPRILGRMPFADRALYRQSHLPQGSPVSPALANQLCFRLDKRLTALGARLDATYTRYADDLTFSGDCHIAATLLDVVPKILRDEGFHINSAKTRVLTRGARQVVTGIVVNQHLNIDRATFDRLKAIIHACHAPDDTRLHDPVFRTSLLGKIGWVEALNPARGQKLRRLLDKP